MHNQSKHGSSGFSLFYESFLFFYYYYLQSTIEIVVSLWMQFVVVKISFLPCEDEYS